jgi:hypothetical protein
MQIRLYSLFLCLAITGLSAIAADHKYQNDFQKAELDSFPEDMLLIAGDFAVKEENGNKFLELPGAPLDAFSLLFGPNAKDNAAASALIYGTGAGRKFPAFEVGVLGVGGYKLRVSPAKRALELYRGETLKTSAPLKWESAKWTHLKLQVVKAGEKSWKIEGKCWTQGAQEPAQPTLVFEDTEAPPSGRASVGGMPYSGTPIRFDDLVVSEAAK